MTQKDALFLIIAVAPIVLSISLIGIFGTDWLNPIRRRIHCHVCGTGFPVSWIESCEDCRSAWDRCTGFKNHIVLCNKHEVRWRNIQGLEEELL